MALKAVLLIFTVAVVNANNDNLIAVVQLFRHGQRTPTNFYSTDPYQNIDTYWGGLDYGQLTNEGKRQHFELGQFTRRRYSDWLPTTYSSQVIYAQTTDVDRTHMSAQSNLYGLFSAKNTQVWRKSVDWQPIPIHPSDKKIINAFVYNCPTYYALLANITEERDFVDLDLTYASVYEYISRNTGDNVTSFSTAGGLYDSLLIEEQVGYAPPSWTNTIYPEPVRTLYTKWFETFSYNTQLQRYSSGLFLNTIVEYFEEMLKDPTSSPKYQMYSAHDLNVYSVLNTLGQKPEKALPFAVSLWFEIRRINWIDVVNLWMRSNNQLTQLSIKGCALDCPLTEVKSLLSDILVDMDTWEKECAGTSV